jgi:hypothetical protein
MDKLVQRRLFCIAVFGVLVNRSSIARERDTLPHLNVTDPLARSLNYTENAAGVETVSMATRQPNQYCANCNHYAGTPDGFGPCDLFPCKAVSGKGWCSGWAKEE